MSTLRFGYGEIISLEGDDRLLEIFATHIHPTDIKESTHFVRITDADGNVLSIGALKDNAPNASLKPFVLIGGCLKAYLPSPDAKVIMSLEDLYRLNPTIKKPMEGFIEQIKEEGWNL
ncbi:hypothetical protein EON83_12405 [bacterium]|nr:MAG: hypothetical protein EON83_12405 [bacterium]